MAAWAPGAWATGAWATGAWSTDLSPVGSSNTLVYTISRPIGNSETLTLDYTQPGDGIEDGEGNDLLTFSGRPVTNLSNV